MIVNIPDTANVDYDGLYTITHADGYAAEDPNKILLCHVEKPPSKYLAGYSEPFTITKEDFGTQLIVEFEQYLLTNELDCGAV